jgi:branched-chain amino acid transport system permease protein
VSTFIQTLIVGLRLGSIYALVALGYTMVYGIIRLINFAHGDFIMVGGYTMIFTIPLIVAAGLPAWVSVIFAVAVCALVGMGTELIAYRPVRKKGTNMTALITAIAMSLFLENMAQAIPAVGPNPKVASQMFATGGISIGGVTLEYTTMLTVVIGAMVMVVLYEFTQKTRMGRAMRCVSEDKEAATLMGIHVNHTILLTFAIGSGLSAIAGLMYIAQYPKVFTTMGVMLGLKAFVAAVLGGIGIIPGAMLGGLVIGLVESFTTSYVSSSMADTFVFLILIVVLVLKPAGIMGKNVGEKV